MEDGIGARIAIPAFTDSRGSLSVVELQRAIPFQVQRVFYLHGVPQGAVRGNHATYSPEFLICAAGSCRVRLNDGQRETEELFSAAGQGILLPPLTWRSFSDFSDDCLLLCFSDRPYADGDIIRDFDLFLKLKSDVGETHP